MALVDFEQILPHTAWNTRSNSQKSANAERAMPDTNPSLLIVDDDAVVRMSLAGVLAEIGYQVRTAEDGHGALEEIGREVPEILISDLNMPGMSGFELLQVVRQKLPDLRTIAMSGAFSGDEVPSGVAADAFYQKGSSIASLLQVMGKLPSRGRIQYSHQNQGSAT